MRKTHGKNTIDDRRLIRDGHGGPAVSTAISFVRDTRVDLAFAGPIVGAVLFLLWANLLIKRNHRQLILDVGFEEAPAETAAGVQRRDIERATERLHLAPYQVDARASRQASADGVDRHLRKFVDEVPDLGAGPTSTMSKPRAARFLAISRPMPAEAPVTRASWFMTPNLPPGRLCRRPEPRFDLDTPRVRRAGTTCRAAPGAGARPAHR